MLSLHTPCKPAPMLARGALWLGRRGGATAFGNAIGGSIASQSEPQAQGHGPWSDRDYRNGMDVDSDTYPDRIARQQEQDRFVQTLAGMMQGGQSYDNSNDVLLAAGDGFTMGRGPVSVEQRGRRIYITEQGAEPSIDETRAKARADLMLRQRMRDEALTTQLNLRSVIRETVTPIFEPITVEVSPMLSAIAGGVGDVVTGGIAGVADITVAPIADLAQAGMKALHGAITGDFQPLTPMSSYGDSVVNGSAGTWEGVKSTGVNVFNVSPLGMVYHAGTGGYGLTTAAMNGDVRAATREGLGLGLNFAGAAAIPLGVTRTPYTPSLRVQAETSALQRIAANNRAPTPWADLRQAYQQARGQVDFAHIAADVKFKPNGQVKAQGGHFSTSPQLQRIPGTETVSPNGVIYGQVKLLGPDGNFYLKTNNNGFSSMTPDSWSLAQAKGEMSQAWVNRTQVGNLWFGESSGVKFQFHPPGQNGLWRGYPIQTP